jgi:hypothetical protein
VLGRDEEVPGLELGRVSGDLLLPLFGDVRPPRLFAGDVLPDVCFFFFFPGDFAGELLPPFFLPGDFEPALLEGDVDPPRVLFWGLLSR